MSNDTSGMPLVLGSVTFQSTEIPEQLGQVGGTQMLAVHQFPGGAKTVQALGAFPLPITWEGWLIGATALTRSSQIDRIRATGNQVTLSFGANSWSGYVREFASDIRHQYMVRYKVTFEVVKDNSASASLPAAQTSPSTAFGNSISALSGQAATPANPYQP